MGSRYCLFPSSAFPTFSISIAFLSKSYTTVKTKLNLESSERAKRYGLVYLSLIFEMLGSTFSSFFWGFFCCFYIFLNSNKGVDATAEL